MQFSTVIITSLLAAIASAEAVAKPANFVFASLSKRDANGCGGPNSVCCGTEQVNGQTAHIWCESGNTCGQISGLWTCCPDNTVCNTVGPCGGQSGYTCVAAGSGSSSSSGGSGSSGTSGSSSGQYYVPNAQAAAVSAAAGVQTAASQATAAINSINSQAAGAVSSIQAAGSSAASSVSSAATATGTASPANANATGTSTTGTPPPPSAVTAGAPKLNFGTSALVFALMAGVFML